MQFEAEKIRMKRNMKKPKKMQKKEDAMIARKNATMII